MIKSYFQSNRGSTLAMMILLIGVLVILGVALLSATVVGYNTRVQESRNKSAVYIAEAGLDEAYAYLGEEVENASQYSRRVYVATELINHPNQGLEADYKAHMDNYFKEGYKTYFIENRAVIERRLQELLNIRAMSNTPYREQIQSITATISQSFTMGEGHNGPMQIDFRTVVQQETVSAGASSPTQTIEATLEVVIPDYEAPYRQSNRQVTFRRNALIDKALAMDENFYVTGGDVTVNGNLFAYGSDTAALPSGTTGGISVGAENALGVRDNGSLTVNGNVDTNRYLQIQFSSASQPSNIIVNRVAGLRGEVACNSLVIQGNALGAAQSSNNSGSITVAGDATVLDDTELNAEQSSIQIAGNYYGFSHGNITHNESSSLIINAEDIDTVGGSSLTISGNGSGRSFIKGTGALATTVAVPSGVYLAGTVYVDEAGSYQTGDSVSVVENYLTYSENLKMPRASFTGATDDFDKYAGIDPTDLSYESYYGDFGDLSLVKDRKNTPSETVGKTVMNVEDKIKYGYYGYLQDRSRLKLGGTSKNILVSNMRYSLGNYIDAGTTADPTAVMKNGIGAIAGVSDALGYMSNLYNYKVCQMSDCQREDNFLTYANLAVYPGIRNWLKDTWKTTGTVNSDAGTNTPFYYANNTAAGEDKAVIVLGRGFTPNVLTSLENQIRNSGLTFRLVDVSTQANPTMEGIILAKQNVYFLGQVTFNGLVATEKSIYCMDKGSKVFNNQQTDSVDNFVVNRVIEDTQVRNSVGAIGNWFKQEDATWTRTLSRTVSVSDIYTDAEEIGDAMPLHQAVHITSWRKTP